ncbi:pilus assembly protein PilY [Rhodanobacter sp. Root561]|uniref:pilus assembly protein n=1 Tax=Rhodanobacter sp. Root561 TaxID=1736560 RepID=UPI0006FC19EF|nr:PilC/PilY family type IV pilus protein [Rhodanobacter sp. Root561]KQZ74507.1 pilus assembly protein PilY [Rhodanobacter sp. Root561]
MNITPRLHSKSGNLIGRLLTIGVSVWLLGVAFTPALAATQNPVVEQAPLIIQKPLPPNIVLMLDDSGSMDSDLMPDSGSLPSDTAGTTSNPDSYRIASNNGTYYDPTITYKTPPYATKQSDGSTNYPVPTNIGAAPNNGFSGTSTKDVTSYNGGTYDYFTSLQVTTTTPYDPIPVYTYSCPSGGSLSTKYPGYCYNNGNYYPATATISSYSCNGTDSKNADGKCVLIGTANKNFFTYDTGTATGKLSDGTLVRNYVGKTAGDCASLTSATAKAVCKDDATTQKNVATWFSFYRTRMLMAKSGVMNAFSGVESNFRVGFGSIGGSNASKSSLGDDYYAFTTSAHNVTYQTGIAQVKPFGDGTTGTQKSRLWSWLVGTTPSSWTPLRGALDALGKYYRTQQPWLTLNGESGYVSGTNTELACRQSYTILTTDGFWNDDAPANIGNVDNTKAGPIPRPNNLPTVTYTPASPYSDSNSSTLADVAMKYWVTDLRTASNEVPTSKEDPAYWQHMVTFTLGMGFSPVNILGDSTADKDIFAWANGGSAIANFKWPTPSKDNINNIADLEHAAVNGHGGFASAKTPDEFSNALKKALQRASDRVGTGASLAANSTQLKTGAFAYQANYYTGDWKGDLKAIKVDPNNGTLATSAAWTVSSEMPAATDRKIYTCVTCTTSSATAVAFKTVTDLSSAQQTALGSDATARQSMLDYLRGEGSKEVGKTNGTYRARTTPLGDIVDSQPVYVGQPDPNQFVGQSFTGSDTYLSHASTVRNSLIFVAANDGMLHAFYTDDIPATATTTAISAGTEAFAYLPSAVITTNTSTTTPARATSDLTTLSDPGYGTTTAVPHQYFNDGELTVADVYFGLAWHTVAVGTTGRGLAKAVYALDVTNSTPKLLWERSAGDGKTNADYIGQMTGKPVIAQTNDGSWSVLIGNGYNSKNGSAALLQFAISDGTLNVHTTDDTITGNGLAAPAVWIGDLSVGISTVAYAGDAKGNVWSFGLNTATVTKGTGQDPDVTTYTETATSIGTKLFTATDGTNAQPITAGMLVGKNPTTQDLWLFFGTGQYLGNGDLATKTTQSWYGLIVKAGPSSGSKVVTTSTTRTSTTTQLKRRSIIAETPGTDAVLNDDGTIKTAAIAPARAVTALPTTSDMTDMSGWYMDLLSPTSTTADGKVTYTANQTAQGERIVTPNQFQGNQLLATTRIPEAADLCNPSGRGWIMAVDPFTGTNPKSSFFDLNGDGQINQPADYIMVNGTAVATSGIGFSSLPNNPIFMGGTMLVSFDNGSASSIKTSSTSNGLQRVSWRELIAQ